MANKYTENKQSVELPPEFETEADFLRSMRDYFDTGVSYDEDNRKAGEEDLEFVSGNQWEDSVKQYRAAKNKPVLTVNRIPAFVGQVLGTRLQNETIVKVTADSASDKNEAKVREALIRQIQKASKAEKAYTHGLSGAVMCGIGNWKLDIDYSNDRVWHSDIKVNKIVDHYGVVWDPDISDSTGADASWCFVVDSMPSDSFKALYPDATPGDMLPRDVSSGVWFSGDNVQIVEYWQMREVRSTIALLVDGETVDISDLEDDDPVISQIVVDQDGEPMVRQVYRKTARMYLCTGADVLEGPYDLPIDRVPVFRVPGWEVSIGDTTNRWGCVRFMKDPQRLHNYWRSAIAEKISRSPKNTWLAADSAVAGREQQYRDSATSDDPLLVWNADSGAPPVMQPPTQIESALITEANMSAQDMKDVTNVHEANLGMPSNEVSGVAIRQRVRVTDTGLNIYFANLESAIRETGRIMNDLIPVVYDTKRVVTILGEDGRELQQAINDLTNPDALDITGGSYQVTANTGPSRETQREQAEQGMMALTQAMPQVFGVAGDLIVKAMDWPMADEIAARLHKAVPPNLLDPDELSDQQKQAAMAQQKEQQQQAQIQMQQAQLAMQAAMANIGKDKAQAESDMARAQHYLAQIDVAKGKLQNESLETASKAASRELQDSLDAINTAHATTPQDQAEGRSIEGDSRGY